MLEPWAEKIMYYMAHATIIILAIILALLGIMLICALILGCVELIKSICEESD